MFDAISMPAKQVTVTPISNSSQGPKDQIDVEDIPESCVIYEEQSFHLFCKDLANQKALDFIKCTIVDPVSDKLHLDMNRLKDGYEVLFTPSDCGRHELSIKVLSPAE